MRRPAVSRRTVALIAGALLAAAALGALALDLDGRPAARPALEHFLAAWEEGDYSAAAALTDAAPGSVQAALSANRDGLDGAALEAEVIDVDEHGDEAEAEVEMSWRVPVIGGFGYRTRVRLAFAAGDWRLRWAPRVIHPQLQGGQRLGTVRELPGRAPILDRHGRTLVCDRPVVDVGIVPSRLRGNARAAIAAIARYTDADPRNLRRALRGAGPLQHVVAITVRRRELAPVRARLERVPGVVLVDRMLSLAPTREFGRALLGAVGPITAQQLEQLGDPYTVGSEVGQWGLAESFERRLAGEPAARVIVRRADGTELRTLHEVPARPGRPLRTTLDGHVQHAAERALGAREGRAALIAIDASSGDLLAVATRPVDDTFNRALAGRYPPGSAFKVVTTAALLRGGLDPDVTVNCPPAITVGGKLFRNFEGGAEGAVPFRHDFAISCNTAFVSLADRLGPADLPQMAGRFGLGRSYELAAASFAGSVPRPRDAAEQAAETIGQGRILVSPLALAGVAATVASGRWHQPRLLASDPREEGPRLPGSLPAQLRALMRRVVSSGTGTAVAGVRGRVGGKSGTAEYGSGNPPPTHAWFIAFRGELAVAALVEDRPSGGRYAAPVVARFFAALDR